jgi:hypothetical protein
MANERRRMDLPDRRKNTYEDLEKKLDGHIDQIEEKFDRWFRRGLIIIALIGLCCAAALGGVYLVLGEVAETRRDFTRSQCEAQNKHNRDTSAQLTALALQDEKERKTEEAKEEVRRRRDVTLALIDALAPEQDCDYLVKLAVGEATPTPVPEPTPPGP